MVSLSTFTIGDVLDCTNVLRSVGAQADSMEDAAQRTVDWLQDNLVDHDGALALSLARVLATVAYEELPAALAERAVAIEPTIADDPIRRCTVLLGSAGVRPEWNGVEQSRNHRVMPMPACAGEGARELDSLVGAIGFDPGQLRADATRAPTTARFSTPFRLLYMSADIADHPSAAAASSPITTSAPCSPSATPSPTAVRSPSCCCPPPRSITTWQSCSRRSG